MEDPPPQNLLREETEGNWLGLPGFVTSPIQALRDPSYHAN